MFGDVSPDNILNNGLPICEVLKNANCNVNINTCDIGFTLSNRINQDDDDDYIDQDTYNASSNKFEVIELMSKIKFLVDKFIKNNPNVNIFVLGKDTHNTKLKIYLELYKNAFLNDFKMFEGECDGYYKGAYYFINKNIINETNNIPK